MDVGIRSPLLDFFRRGEVGKDIRMLAARGALAPRAHEQLAMLVLLTADGDAEIRGAAEATLAAIPNESLAAFLGRSDVPEAMREFFRGRGVEPAPGQSVTDAPLIDTDPAGGEGDKGDGGAESGEVVEGAEGGEGDEGGRQSVSAKLALMNVADRVKAAMKGSKEERAALIRDPNKLVSAAVLSSPKVSESEVTAFAKMANVSEEVLRIIGMNRGWVKNYGVVAALVRNPKTPLGVSMNFVQRLNDKDLKLISMDRNLQEPLKLAVKKRLTSGPDSKG